MWCDYYLISLTPKTNSSILSFNDQTLYIVFNDIKNVEKELNVCCLKRDYKVCNVYVNKSLDADVRTSFYRHPSGFAAR